MPATAVEAPKFELPPALTELRAILAADGKAYPQILLDRLQEQITEAAATIQEKEDAIAAVENRWVQFQLQTDLETEFFKSGGNTHEFEDVAPTLNARLQLDSSGATQFLDAKGKPDPAVKSIAQLISQMKVERPGFAKHFGAIDQPDGGDGSRTTAQAAAAALLAWDKVEQIREAAMSGQQAQEKGLAAARSQQAALNPNQTAWQRVEAGRQGTIAP